MGVKPPFKTRVSASSFFLAVLLELLKVGDFMYLIRLMLLQVLIVSPIIVFAVVIALLLKFRYKLVKPLYITLLVFNILLLVISILFVTIFEIGVLSELASGNYLAHTT